MNKNQRPFRRPALKDESFFVKHTKVLMFCAYFVTIFTVLSVPMYDTISTVRRYFKHKQEQKNVQATEAKQL